MTVEYSKKTFACQRLMGFYGLNKPRKKLLLQDIGLNKPYNQKILFGEDF